MSFHKDNGMLAKVPGEVIGATAKSLPPPGPGQPAEMKVVANSGERGMVRITYQLASHYHGKTKMWSWRAVHAEAVSEGQK